MKRLALALAAASSLMLFSSASEARPFGRSHGHGFHHGGFVGHHGGLRHGFRGHRSIGLRPHTRRFGGYRRYGLSQARYGYGRPYGRYGYGYRRGHRGLGLAAGLGLGLAAAAARPAYYGGYGYGYRYAPVGYGYGYGQPACSCGY
ncbi:hypothetical protein [Methylobacterium indicum]|uniref:Sulfur globule protein n=1 Tax=Methylobacterium indicum TaxID=1775910 RepID=A0A8H9C6H8_9HYPH|nr:hypothetical protein [Methylobacterium indicum]BCM83761.1 hypothetical protein mvi_22220 [Methylobacterium indicum]